MAKSNKRSNNRAWKNERASVNSKNQSRAKNNKYRPTSDSKTRSEVGSPSRYWRAGYTRKDGTKVKGHYVKNPHPS